MAPNDLLEEFEVLANEFRTIGGVPGDVAARVRRAANQPKRDGIADADHDYGDRSRRVMGSLGRRRDWRHDQVNLEAHQVSGELRQAIEFALRPPVLDDDILAFDVAELAKTLAKLVHVRSRGTG